MDKQADQPEMAAANGEDEPATGVFHTISSTDLVTQIARQITEAIVSGSLRPGARLTELQLSREFGTSRAPVREAARLLESQGLVVSSPRRGFFVRTLEPQDLHDIYELRIGLEVHAALLAVDRITEPELDRLQRQIQKMYALADEGSLEQQIMEDFTFHRLLCAASGNRRLLKVYDELATEMRCGIALIGRLFDSAHRLAETHEPVLDALRERNAEKLTAAVRYHIVEAQHQVVELFTEIRRRTNP
ncbi:GntR family transcriptional regulator [Nitratireductor basaltis]|uniref:Transcriptional regulator n=1 Tax=Nitratireductor basaltis TaxID=472175 RepID=A0A084U5L7_9HYPH|nr:GntR family transcriptional regulator [Nitratireductor basaltis]KFB08253.1 Transcriptional regulator [Nitratireductor basaltis]